MITALFIYAATLINTMFIFSVRLAKIDIIVIDVICMSMFIVLGIVAFIFDKKSNDNDEFTQHFLWQRKTFVALLVFSVVVTVAQGLMKLDGLVSNTTLLNKEAHSIILVLMYTASLILSVATIVFYMWFLYKNIKGLIYLICGKDL